jgi:hypothetical protein
MRPPDERTPGEVGTEGRAIREEDAAIVADAVRPDKAFATAQARAALLGVVLTRIEDDRGRQVFIVTRWALTRELHDLAAVDAWLDRLEDRAA